MTPEEIKLRQYIIEVAIVEIPLLKLITAVIKLCGDEIPEETTLGSVLNYYINKIDKLDEKSKIDTQENYDNVYDEFLSILNNDIEPTLMEEATKEEQLKNKS